MNQAQKRHEELKYLLRISGTSFSELSRQLGVSHTNVLSVSRGKTKSRRVAEAISDIVGRPVETIWPELYSEKDYDMI